MSSRVVVVGAGIAGLAAGFRLRRAGFEVTVLEAADRVGGRMWTVERDGYRIDTGAMVLSTQYRQLAALARDAGLGPEMVRTRNTIGFLRDGTVHRLSTTNPLTALGTGLMSVKDKAAMTAILADLARYWRRLDDYDLRRAVPLDDEDLVDYAVRRGLSRGAIDAVIEPLGMSLSFVDARCMSKVAFLWALRRVFGGNFFTFPGGLGTLPLALAAELDVVLDTRVHEVREHADRVTVRSDAGVLAADGVVVALPAPAIPEMCPGLDDERRAILADIGYASSMHVHFGLKRAGAETSTMVYTTPARHDDLGVTFFEHNKAPGRAPAGKGLLSTYFGGGWAARHWDLDDEQVIAVARRTAAGVFPDLLGDPDNIDMSFVSRARTCVVVNDPGRCRHQARLLELSGPGSRVQLAGDFFSCSSTNTSLHTGERAARCLTETLRPVPAGRPNRTAVR
jgi:oxygen-dependent protoporphyrinogen oxidase